MNAAELSVVQFPTAGDSFNANSGSTVTISGGEFRLDGLLIDGLGTVGNAVAVNIRVGALLSGTMADGIPFAFESGTCIVEGLQGIFFHIFYSSHTYFITKFLVIRVSNCNFRDKNSTSFFGYLN